MIKRLFVLSVAVLLWAGSVAAKDLSINAFAGQWRGNALSESADSVYFQLTTRDLDVQIEPNPQGFSISWHTVQRKKGDPRNPTAVSKLTKLTFVAAGRPSLWRAAEANDPMQAGYAWARIRQNTLTVSVMQIGEDGAFELQTFDRTLSGEGMTLTFARYRNGEKVRTAKGRLVKIAR
jgi:hypothetical protein